MTREAPSETGMGSLKLGSWSLGVPNVAGTAAALPSGWLDAVCPTIKEGGSGWRRRRRAARPRTTRDATGPSWRIFASHVCRDVRVDGDAPRGRSLEEFVVMGTLSPARPRRTARAGSTGHSSSSRAEISAALLNVIKKVDRYGIAGFQNPLVVRRPRARGRTPRRARRSATRFRSAIR